MVDIYTKEDYAKSYTELLEILKYIPRNDLRKIPREKIEIYIKNKDYNYKYEYNTKLSFEEQNILKLTKILIANLYIEYWAETEEKEYIKKKDKEELAKIHLKNKDKYDIDKVFRNKQKVETINNEVQSMIVVKEKNIIKRIVNNIKKFLRLQ